MKTVQEYFKNINREVLIETYMRKHLYIPDECNITEVKMNAKRDMEKLIDRFVSLEIQTDEDGLTCIFFARSIMDSGKGEVETVLFCLEELMTTDSPTTLACCLMPQAKAMGFQVSDDEYTQENILEVLMYIMHELSFFGLEQEELEGIENLKMNNLFDVLNEQIIVVK